MTPVTLEDVISYCKSLTPKSSYGYDGISNKLLKAGMNEIANPFSYIINPSFNTGTFPSKMKLARVIPIFKAGSNQLISNYRPISLLPAFSKLLEKAMYKQLIQFLDQHHILYRHQYDFRKKHSSIHPILHLLKYITENNDKVTSDFTCCIFLDLVKAFDTLNHGKLLNKLRFYGIRSIALNWFESYLAQQNQYVEMRNCKSKTKSILHGVPQGSILGPLLFLIFINDIPYCTTLNILSFADDTTAYMAGNKLDILFRDVNEQLGKLYKWLFDNSLTLNIQKTKYIIFFIQY